MKKKIFLVTSSGRLYHLYWLMKNLIKIDRFRVAHRNLWKKSLAIQ